MKLKTIFESVYNEFGKLDSLEEKLSPKLKALLAAGLIGTASLGMQSCAQPTGDDGTNYPPAAPSTELTDDKTPADDTKKGENTVKEVEIGNGHITVTNEEEKALNNSFKNGPEPFGSQSIRLYLDNNFKIFIYQGNGFSQYLGDGTNYDTKSSYYYHNGASKTVYVIPETEITNNN